MKNILLIGDSHLGAIKHGHKRDPDRFPWISFANLGRGGIAPTRFFAVDEKTARVRITAPEWRALEFSSTGVDGQPPADLVVVSLPINTSRILRAMSWDTHVPWTLKKNDHEVALSEAFVESLIDQDSGNAVEFAIALANIGLPVAVLEAPRFFEDAPYLKTCRFEVIQHVDQHYRQRTRQRLAQGGVDVIGQPAQTISERGTTKMTFDNERPGDTHHANAIYGELILAEMRDYAAEKIGLSRD